jgi:hypothetical protein
MDSTKKEFADAVHQLLNDRLNELFETEGVFGDFPDSSLEITRIAPLQTMVRLKLSQLPVRYFTVTVAEPQ